MSDASDIAKLGDRKFVSVPDLPLGAPLSGKLVDALTGGARREARQLPSLAVIRFRGADWLVGELGTQLGEVAADRLDHHDADRVGAGDRPLVVPQFAWLGEYPGCWLPIAFRIDGERVPVLGRLVDGHVKHLLDEAEALGGLAQSPGEIARDVHQRIALGAGEDFGNGGVARIGRQAAGKSALQAFAHARLRWLKRAIKALFHRSVQ